MFYFCIPKANATTVAKAKLFLRPLGEMVEWSITAVLKTAVLRGTGGSNPSLSAINLENQVFMRNVHEFVHDLPRNSPFRGFSVPKIGLPRP